ncbi:MAG: MFS transporter [Cyanobacteriota bacterium]
MKEKNIYSNVYKLNLYWFFHSLNFFYVIERLFSIERGLNIQEMVYLEIIYAFLILLLEVPTGIISDLWDRRKIMILSGFFTLLSIFVLTEAYSFFAFSLAIIFAAISTALYSGTSNSILYDSLKTVNKQTFFEKNLGLSNALSSISAGIGALGGSFIALKYSYSATYYLSLITAIIAFIISFSFIEPKKTIQNDSKDKKFSFKEIILFFRKDLLLYFIIIVAVVTSSCLTYIDEYWQIFFDQVKVPIYLFGIFSIIREFFISLSSFLANKIKEMFSLKKIFFFNLLFSGICLTISGLLANKIGVIFIVLSFLSYGIIEVLTLGYIHHKIESEFRATIESFFSLISRVLTIIIGLIFGFITTNNSIFLGFIFLGIFMILSSFYGVLFLLKKTRNSNL